MPFGTDADIICDSLFVLGHRGPAISQNIPPENSRLGPSLAKEAVLDGGHTAAWPPIQACWGARLLPNLCCHCVLKSALGGRTVGCWWRHRPCRGRKGERWRVRRG